MVWCEWARELYSLCSVCVFFKTFLNRMKERENELFCVFLCSAWKKKLFQGNRGKISWNYLKQQMLTFRTCTYLHICEYMLVIEFGFSFFVWYCVQIEFLHSWFLERLPPAACPSHPGGLNYIYLFYLFISIWWVQEKAQIGYFYPKRLIFLYACATC